MNRFIKSAVLLAFLPVLFTQCSKDAGFSATPAAPTAVVDVPVCRINGESTDQASANGSQFALAYDNDGNLVSVLSTNPGSSQIITNTTISSKQIAQNLDGVGPIQTFDFDQDIYSGQPMNYTVTRPSTPSSNRSLTISYDNSGRIFRVTAYRAVTNAFLQAMNVAYDKDGNVAALTYSAGTGSSAIQSTYNATKFDDRHNPYDSVKGAAFLMYNWDYFFGDVSSVFRHLSHHNPMGWEVTDGTNSNNATFSYQYNAEGYPVTVTQNNVAVYDGVTTTSTAVVSYSYDCK